MSELRFRVISADPHTNSGELVQMLLDDLPELEKDLHGKNPTLEFSVEADRQKSMPIDPATAYLVLKFAGAAIASGFLKKLGEDAYVYLKGRLRNGSIERPTPPPETSSQAAG